MPVYRHPESGDRVIPSDDESGRQYVETLERAGYVVVKGTEAEETELERVTRERDELRKAGYVQAEETELDKAAAKSAKAKGDK